MALKHCMVWAFGWGRVLAAPEKSVAAVKWRPSLAIVLGGTLGFVLLLPLAGIVLGMFLERYLDVQASYTIIFGSVVFVTGVLGFLLWRLIMRPVQALVEHSQDVLRNPNADHVPLPHYGTSELRGLGQAVLDMSHSLAARTRNLQAYTDHVTHELKSPLTSIVGATELLNISELPEDQKRQLLQDIAFSADRMSKLLDAMRSYREMIGVDSDPTSIDLTALELPKLITVRFFGRPTLPLSPEVATIVFTHFLRNAAEHGATRVDVCEIEDGVLIADDGTGISTANQSSVFDPFFTTKRATGGTGMGLTIVKTLLENGGLKVDLWQKNGGCVFAIRP